MTKIDFPDNTKQVAVAKVDLGFGIKYDIKDLKKANKVTDAQVLNFKCGVIQFLAALCNSCICDHRLFHNIMPYELKMNHVKDA